jgi:RHS repeat-associated protein
LRQIYQQSDGWATRDSYFNNQGLVTNRSDALGTESATTFDVEDRPLWVMDANGVTVTNAYDLLGRLTTRTYPDGGVERFAYTSRGLTNHVNQLSQTNWVVLDEALRKTYETNADGQVLQFAYDASGNLTNLVDGKGHSTQFNWDEYSRQTNKLDQSGTVILKYAYDANGRLLSRWSVAKGTTYYTNDAVGNVTYLDYPHSHSVSLAYDPLNRVTSMVDAVGTTAYAYTTGGQVWTEDGPFANDTVTNTYSSRMRTSLVLQQPTGTWTNGFGWDTAERLTNVTSQAGSFGYTYAIGASFLPIKVSLPNTSYITNTYDNVARLTGTWLKNSGGTVLDSATYGYNQGNQRTAYTNAANTNLFTYDNIGQLTSDTTYISAENRGYLYDAGWNLNWRTNNGAATQFSVDNKNQLTTVATTAYAYDSNGNLASVGSGTNYAYFYDDENRLIQWFHYVNGMSNPSTNDVQSAFTYDGLGRLRIRQEYSWQPTSAPNGPLVSSGNWNLTSTTEYIYDGNRVIQERDGSNNPTVAYTRGTDLSGSLEGAGGIGGLLGRSSGYSLGNWSTHYFYHADGNGNITYLVNSSQGLAADYRYDPFGNLVSSGGTMASANVYRFSSKEVHANSGMYYYLYRFYDPNLQRWISMDPLSERGAALTMRMNRAPAPGRSGPNGYAFSGNAPIWRLDPWGLEMPWPGYPGRPCPFHTYVCTITCTDTGETETFTYTFQTCFPPDGGFCCRQAADFYCASSRKWINYLMTYLTWCLCLDQKARG